MDRNPSLAQEKARGTSPENCQRSLVKFALKIIVRYIELILRHKSGAGNPEGEIQNYGDVEEEFCL